MQWWSKVGLWPRSHIAWSGDAAGSIHLRTCRSAGSTTPHWCTPAPVVVGPPFRPGTPGLHLHVCVVTGTSSRREGEGAGTRTATSWTWFSSGLCRFSTLGCPECTESMWRSSIRNWSWSPATHYPLFSVALICSACRRWTVTPAANIHRMHGMVQTSSSKAAMSKSFGNAVNWAGLDGHLWIDRGSASPLARSQPRGRSRSEQ